MSTNPFQFKAKPLALAALAALLLLFIGINPAAAQEYGQPEPGRYVYDQAGLLTPEELATLEARAEAVEQAGAPVVVFLRAEEADFDETLEDGRELMESWDVQSDTDARDGVVVFLNLDPDDLRSGQLAVVAGEAHFDGGKLPQYELDRITSEMLALLRNDETAQGIAIGLEMIAESLTNGPAPPPEPSQFQRTSADLSRGPFSVTNIVSVLVAGALAVLSTRVWRSRPVSDIPVTPSVVPPDADLMPAAAGALAGGRINDMQMEATILDLARRGALRIEPEDVKKKVQVRLLDSCVLQNDVEQQVWNALETEAQDDRLVSSKRLSKVRTHWGPAKEELRSGLESRGWYEPDPGRRRVPLYLAGSVTLLLAIVAFIVSLVGEQYWGLFGAGILTIAGLTGLTLGASIPDTTATGEDQAQPWRGYLKGLKDVQNDDAVDVNLDEAVPYAVAMNARTAVDKRLKRASESGYSPLWFLGSSRADGTWGTAGFYPYWATFHAGVSPTAGAGSGGASAGSGGSGGGF